MTAYAQQSARDVLEDVKQWAEARCPCNDDAPDPCPLCGETVASGVCKAFQGTFPQTLADKIDRALRSGAKEE